MNFEPLEIVSGEGGKTSQREAKLLRGGKVLGGGRANIPIFLPRGRAHPFPLTRGAVEKGPPPLAEFLALSPRLPKIKDPN